MSKRWNLKEWRHVILVLGVLLAAEQVRSGTSGYLYFVEIRQTSLLGEGKYILERIRRRGVMHREQHDQSRIQENFDELQSAGLRYVALQRFDRSFMEVGERTVAPDIHAWDAPGFQKSLENRLVKTPSGLVFDFVPIEAVRFPPGLIERIFRSPDIPLEPERLDRDKRHRIPGLGPPPRGSNPPPFQLVEFEPVRTNELERRAITLLIFGILGALITLIASAWLWWVIGQRDRAQQEAREKAILAKLGQMSAIISHELRNPLAGAMGQMELLSMMLEGTDREHAKAENVLEDLRRLENLSTTLLAFVNSRRVELVENKCQVLVDSLTRLTSDDRLVVDAKHMPETSRFDEITLVRAVDNLISNALIFTGESGKVYLTLGQEDGALTIAVRDEGPGFPEGLDMFEPFVTTRDKGTGLGLAIAAEVVRSHGGTISAVNHPRGGAVVSISIPG